MDLAAIRNEYRRDRASYELLIDKAEAILGDALKEARCVAHIEKRVKTVASLVRKVIRKNFDADATPAEVLARIGDKAGLRVVVAHLADAQRVCRVVSECFDAEEFEDTADRYEPDTLGYLGRHAQAKLKGVCLDSDTAYLGTLDFEVQVHTKAQNAWSTVSHPLLYKPPDGKPPRDVASKVYRAVALVSLFDEQIDEARAKMASRPSYRPALMLDVLQREFVEWMTEPVDEQLSLLVLGVVVNAYSEEDISRFDTLVPEFLAQHKGTLDTIFSAYTQAGDEHPLLFQPESLAIYERLFNAKARLREAWLQGPLALDLLTDLASIFAMPYS